MLERFLCFGPSRFDSRGGPKVTETWFIEMEKILGRLHLPPSATMISLATYTLTGKAYDWWMSVQSCWRVKFAYQEDQDPRMTREEFSWLFFDHNIEFQPKILNSESLIIWDKIIWVYRTTSRSLIGWFFMYLTITSSKTRRLCVSFGDYALISDGHNNLYEYFD